MKRSIFLAAILGVLALVVLASKETTAMPYQTFSPPIPEYQFAVNGVVPNGVQPLRLTSAAADALQTGEGRGYPILDLTTQRVTFGVNTTQNTQTGDVSYNVSKNGNPVGTAITVTAGSVNNLSVSFAVQFAPGDLIGVQATSITAVGNSRALCVVKLQ